MTILFRDDFNGSRLDTSRWALPKGDPSYIPITQFRPTKEAPDVENGAVQLELDTYNPSAQTAGDSFYGTNIFTKRSFRPNANKGNGIAIEARVKLQSNLPAGIVAGFFSYKVNGPVRDENTFEILTKERNRVLTNTFDDQDFEQSGNVAFRAVPRFNASQYNTFRIEWFQDSVRWLVNGTLVRQETEDVPNSAMNVHLNFWAPNDEFSQAYAASLETAAKPEDNQKFLFQGDYVEVETISENENFVGTAKTDTFHGGRGKDRINGLAGNDLLTGGLDNDLLNGGRERDFLLGEMGNDTLIGGRDADILVGGAGADLLTGGSGRDLFRWEDNTESRLGSIDHITDLNLRQDKLDGKRAISSNAIDQLGSINSLTRSKLNRLLTKTVFEANTAATFSLGQRSFLAINDGIAGYNARNDALIEITGFTGNLSTLKII